MNPFIFTRHACDRFRKRHARHLTALDAEALFKSLVGKAKKLNEKSLTGQDQWLVDEPDQPSFLFVTKNDPNGCVIVTVLSLSMQAPTAAELDELAAARERIAPIFTPPPVPRAERFPVVEYRPLPKPAAPIVVVGAPVARPDQVEDHRRQREATKAKKTAERAGRAAVVAAAAALTGGPISMPWARVTRAQLNIARLEIEAARARAALRVALRALRPLLGDDRAMAAWKAIGAIEPAMITDRFIDHQPREKPALAVPSEKGSPR